MIAGQADDDEATELVAATINGRIILVDGKTSETEWTEQFDRLAAVYAFGDGDGQAEVYAVDRAGKLRALDASDGNVEWTTTLTTEDVQMTPPPALGDLDGDGEPELVAVSQDGTVSVVNPSSVIRTSVMCRSGCGLPSLILTMMELLKSWSRTVMVALSRYPSTLSNKGHCEYSRRHPIDDFVR